VSRGERDGSLRPFYRPDPLLFLPSSSSAILHLNLSYTEPRSRPPLLRKSGSAGNFLRIAAVTRSIEFDRGYGVIIIIIIIFYLFFYFTYCLELLYFIIIIIIIIFLCCAVSVIGLLAVDSAHKK
jgi:hypothetical protein